MRTTGVLTILFALSLLVAGRADAAVGSPDDRGDSGAAPDLIGVSLWIEADELAMELQTAANPPLAFSREGDFTDMLMAFVGTGTAGVNEDTENGFAVSLMAIDGADAVKFADIVDGRMGDLQPNVATAEIGDGRVTFRVPIERLPDTSSIRARFVANRYGGEGGMDMLPEDGAWLTYGLDELGATGPDSWLADMLPILAALLIGGAPLLWVTLRIRSIRRRALVDAPPAGAR